MNLIEQFQAGDEDGNLYTVCVYEHPNLHRPLAGRAAEKPGRTEYFLDTGEDVNPESDDIFRIVQTDTLIARIR